MAKFSHSDSRRMYSWWWDSHISPKNSKWLQENLTDMDAKVKAMIKLIEEDADSFARRAEMYYKKRPELMKLVEEFYRAYRSLAERYDHATGVIRHAHRTMSEAFPNQVPMMFSDDSPNISGTDPRTPELSTPNGEFSDESDPVNKRRPLKPLHDSDRVRKGLNFDEADEKEEITESTQKMLQMDRSTESEAILALKEALAKLEAEKEEGFVQYKQSLEKISELESEVAKAKEELKQLKDHAARAENEAAVLKESLAKVENEKEAKLQEYQHCLEKISDLQKDLSALQEDAKNLDNRASGAETEAESLKAELEKITVEKDAALDQYMESIEMISNLENNLRVSEEDAGRFKERAETAENEVESLKQTILKLNEEKEAAALQYQELLETISGLEGKLRLAEEEAKRLNIEIDDGTSKLKGAEEQCLLLERSNQSLHSELESLMLKMGTQTQELTEKQKELGRLWACVQEEHLRFVEAETAFQTLQHLHAQTQEELRSMASDLQNRARLMKVLEDNNQTLQDEVLKFKEENKQLDELNLSSALSINDMQNEIGSLKESKGKLEEEVELRVDQRNALQQEIYCLKEELNVLNNKHLLVLDEVRSVGFDPEALGSSIKKLQDENSNLKESFLKESREKAVLLEKMSVLDQLLDKNSLLETSLSDLHAELEAVRGKIEALEETCRSLLNEKSALLDEKAALMIRLEETNKNLQSLAEDNNVLVNSLSDANHQLEALKAKSRILEDSCQLLMNDKAGLVSEKNALSSQLEETNTRLKGLGNVYEEMEKKCITLEKEKEATLRRIDDLQMSLELEKQERNSYILKNEAKFKDVEAHASVLQEECELRSRELDRMLGNALENEIEMFVLRVTTQQLQESNCSFFSTNQRLLEERCLSEQKISQLEKDNHKQVVDINSLSDQAVNLRVGICQLLKVLDIVEDHACQDRSEQDQSYVDQILGKLKCLKESLCKSEEENQQWNVELSILIVCLRQLELDSRNLVVERDNIKHEVQSRSEQLSVLQNEVLKILQMNEELKSKLMEESSNKELLMTELELLNRKLMDVQSSCQVLENEKLEISEQKRCLMNDFRNLEEKKISLEEENHILCDRVLALDNLSFIFRSCADEKLMALRRLGDDLKRINEMNASLMGKLSLMDRSLEESKEENICLEERLQKSEEELKAVATVKDELSKEIENEKEVLRRMDLELQEAKEKISLVENEKFELNRSVEDLRQEHADVKIIRDEQEIRIFNLSSDNDRLILENNRLHEASQALEVELKEKINEIENGKEVLCRMELELQEAKEQICLVEKEKFELNRSVEDLRMEHDDVKITRDEQEIRIFNLSSENDWLITENNRLHEASRALEIKLKEKINENDGLETEAASTFGQLQQFMVTQLLFEQKVNELREACLDYMDQNGSLKAQLAAYGPEIISLKDCISSLENQTDIHIKFENPESEEMQDAQVTNNSSVNVQNGDKKSLMPDTLSDLRDLRIRVQAIEKAAVEIKDLMVQENTDLRSKLDACTNQLELLQSEGGRYRRNSKPTSEITETEGSLLTKDIVLDQVSDGSSYGFSKRELFHSGDQIVELWETADPDGTTGLTVEKSKKLVSPSAHNSDFHHVKSIKKQRDGYSISDRFLEKELSIDKLETSKRITEPLQEGNKRKVLERLDSDVQKLANLQITVQDMKRKLEVIEQGKRGKAVIECESLKGQLEEADIAVMKLFELNGRLTKSVEDMTSSLSETKSSSFDLENDGNATRKRRASEQARRMSEKIGRLQLEVQKLQFVLLKLDEGNRKMSESKRRILLRDYLYGGGRTGQRRKKTQFCACVQPSTKD